MYQNSVATEMSDTTLSIQDFALAAALAKITVTHNDYDHNDDNP